MMSIMTFYSNVNLTVWSLWRLLLNCAALYHVQFQTVRGDLQAYILYSQKEINEGYIKK